MTDRVVSIVDTVSIYAIQFHFSIGIDNSLFSYSIGIGLAIPFGSMVNNPGDRYAVFSLGVLVLCDIPP